MQLRNDSNHGFAVFFSPRHKKEAKTVSAPNREQIKESESEKRAIILTLLFVNHRSVRRFLDAVFNKDVMCGGAARTPVALLAVGSRLVKFQDPQRPVPPPSLSRAAPSGTEQSRAEPSGAQRRPLLGGH